MAGYRAAAKTLAHWTGTMGGFTRHLDAQGIPYLSFSKIASVEFCPYSYYLEYVKRMRLRPQPDYLVKGSLFHAAAAKAYRLVRRGQAINMASLDQFVEAQAAQQHQDRLRNAIRLAVDHVFHGWELVDVEQPFVLSLGSSLPPCVGVVDLILRQGDRFAVVDHKTGKSFNDSDEGQLAIYREHAMRTFGSRQCLTMFDEYRWVNDLRRIRKPAFRRTPVKLSKGAWKETPRRLLTLIVRFAGLNVRTMLRPRARAICAASKTATPWRL